MKRVLSKPAAFSVVVSSTGVLSSVLVSGLAMSSLAWSDPAIAQGVQTPQISPSAARLPAARSAAAKPSDIRGLDGTVATTAAAAPTTGAPYDTPVVVPLTQAQSAMQQRVNALETSSAKTAGERNLAAHLASAYAERAYAPYWFEQGVISSAATALVAEIGNAREWGLDPADYFLPKLPTGRADTPTVAAVDALLSFAVVRYAFHARGGRVDPSQLSKWLDQRPKAVDPKALLAELSIAADPAAALRKLHPQHAGFDALRRAYVKLAAPAEPGRTSDGHVLIPPGPTIKLGMRHPDVPLLRERLGILATAAQEDLYDERLGAAVRAYLKAGRRGRAPVIDARVREALNNPASGADRKKPETVTARKLLVNMERWRWLPDELGTTHIWNSLTEFETRVVQDGQVVHQERIVIGKPDTQTPVFSDRMEYVVFQPDWGVPNSIKVKQLLPALQDGDYDVLARRGMKILLNGKEKDPASYDWDKTDIRYVPVFQLPGSDNPLGQVKFMFPNKHDVYMHDTPQKGLFNDQRRTYSHGCIRVRNPRRMAEVVMNLDKSWTARDVDQVIRWGAKPVNRIELSSPIPVHNTYFTAFADADGTVRTAADIYQHDSRILDALDGVPVEEIAERDPAGVLERELQEIAPTARGSGGAAVVMKAPGVRGRSRAVEYAAAPLPPKKPSFWSGFSGVGAYYVPPPPPKPVYYKPAPAPKSGFRSPPTIDDMIMPRSIN